MKKFLFLIALLGTHFNFGSGSVREQFNAEQSEIQNLKQRAHQSMLARLMQAFKKR